MFKILFCISLFVNLYALIITILMIIIMLKEWRIACKKGYKKIEERRKEYLSKEEL